ncbi:Efflux pump FUS6 [Apiospora phragmitis]|uniref:Efflux pump FUS6 n=1 Tax=Apiospora phragmitis TaxID=2905665 RepID=A0ABR1W9X1_9PEZI
MGEEFIWITNSFFLCCATVQPLFGQLCNIFGRRWLMLFTICLFTLGSGICGGATSGAMLIAGRGVQGAGSGGIGMNVSIIIADLVPLRERGHFLALIRILYTVGATSGPIVGGVIVDTISWRWVFWLNLPIGGVALALLYFVLHVLPPHLLPDRQTLLGPADGVALLPMTIISIPGCAIAAILISRTGKFKILHLVGEGVFTLGMGLFALQWEGSTTAEWATYQSIAALGGGVVLETLLPAFQAPVPESDQAAATATWAFIRSVGGIWGVSVPAAIFNNKISELSHTISDPRARQLLEGGKGYQHASAKLLAAFSEPVVAEIRVVYREALKLVWLISVAFSGLAFLLFFLERDVHLREQLETEYGSEDSEPKAAPAADSNALVENQKAS